MIKKIIKYFLILFIILWNFNTINDIKAHPLDVSISVFELWNWKKIKAKTFLHFFEVGFLLDQKWEKIDNFEEIFEKKEIFENFFREKNLFKNNWKTCLINNFEISKQQEFEVYSDWLRLDYKIICPDRIENFYFENRMFIEDFDLQTNKMLFFQGKSQNPIYEKILTSKIFSNEFSLANPKNSDKDSDWDWLYDKEEVIYWTDPNLMDSDFDMYSDWLEVNDWWNPLNPENSPGQKLLVNIENAKQERLNYLSNQDNWIIFEKINVNSWEENLENTWEKIFDENKIFLDSEKNLNEDLEKKSDNKIIKEVSRETSDYSLWWWVLKDTLELVSKQIWKTWEGNFYLMIFFVFLLWVLHVLAPWHWKGILAAYLMEKSSGFKVVFSYSLIFTFTHLIDIIAIAVVIKVFSLWATIWAYIWVLQKIWIIGLFLFSLFFLYNAFKNHKTLSCSCWSCKSKKLFNSPFLLWILSWIAPCSYGWVLFLTVLSLWRIEWLFPVMWVFALWIFFTIFAFWSTIVILKVKTLWRYDNFAKYSGIVSWLVLFGLSVYLLFSVF